MAAQGIKKSVRIAVIASAVLFFAALALAGASRPVAMLRGWMVRLSRPVTGVGEYIGGFSGAPPGEAPEEKEDRIRLSAVLAETEVLKKENESLRRALALKEERAAPMHAAAVLFYSRVLGRETLLLDAGQDQGIVEGDTVIDEHGFLVGEIAEVAPWSSKVSVASNEGTAFSASLLPVDEHILVKGLGGRALALELIPYDTVMREGDVVQWTREGRRGGAPIFAGRVVRGESAARGAFKTGRAVLLAHPEDLKHVLILTSP